MMAQHSIARFTEDGKRYILRDPQIAPLADAYLWNDRLLFRVSCRGYALAHFSQPEPAVYAHAPMMAAKTFLLPEPKYFPHHPGRFFYLRDDDAGKFFSVPYEPVRASLDRFEFAPGLSDIRWICEKNGLEVTLCVTIPRDDVVELWGITVTNTNAERRSISLYSYFPIGYGSWMHTTGAYDEESGGIVCKTLTPYQKTADYFKNKDLKDLTYLISDVRPTSWEASVELFEGEGGWHNPDGLCQPELRRGVAHHENTAAILQFARTLVPKESFHLNLIFGPAKDSAEVLTIKERYLQSDSRERVIVAVDAYHATYRGVIRIETPDADLNHFVNYWLPRQINYHGRTSRLTTDPQTRNYLQDAMGMVFIDPDKAREMFRHALGQQHADGAMPDGILLVEKEELTYINQVPHRDHCVWVSLTIASYLNETGDDALLHERIPFVDSNTPISVYEHICLGLEWLLADRSERGLSLLGQGDWCDPMNMAGYKGKGESGWLTEALSYALQVWTPFCEQVGDDARAQRYRQTAESINQALDDYLWDGDWYARGTTDAGHPFGVSSYEEGNIFLNPQSWGILCGAARDEKLERCIAAVEEHLMTPQGPMMLAPAFRRMWEEIGRLTQKYPGVTENGSVYSHAASFYMFALYAARQTDRAFQALRALLQAKDLDTLKVTQQLPIYLPNCYRGTAFPRVAGRSSRLPNTGTLGWYYRCVTEYLCGLRGEQGGLRIDPQLPEQWSEIRVRRTFRGRTFHVHITRDERTSGLSASMDGQPLTDNFIPDGPSGTEHTLEVLVPVKP